MTNKKCYKKIKQFTHIYMQANKWWKSNNNLIKICKFLKLYSTPWLKRAFIALEFKCELKPRCIVKSHTTLVHTCFIMTNAIITLTLRGLTDECIGSFISYVLVSNSRKAFFSSYDCMFFHAYVQKSHFEESQFISHVGLQDKAGFNQ